MNIQTEQEKFWIGNFGNEYIERNQGGVENNISLFTRILTKTVNVNSIIELGANIGLNLVAIHQLRPNVHLAAVEINDHAICKLKENTYINVIYHESILNLKLQLQTSYDFSFTKGVLIHIAPERLNDAYEVLYKSSNKYILIAEYYNPSPIEVKYRGNEGKLFKRDFAGEFMNKYTDCQLVDYGFVYHRDPVFPLDDVTWFLMKKGNDCKK